MACVVLKLSIDWPGSVAGAAAVVGGLAYYIHNQEVCSVLSVNGLQLSIH